MDRCCWGRIRASIFFTTSLSTLRVFQVAQVAQDVVRIEGLDRLKVEVEVLDQMLHDADDLFVDLEQIGSVVLVGLVIHELVQGVLEMGHAIQG